MDQAGPAATRGGPSVRATEQTVRRLLDVILASLALLCTLPAMVAISIAIFLESGFPVIFRQTRVGLHGKHFQLLKFRKFGPAEPANGLGVTLANDPRMTRVGRFLERTKMDEMPQFWNVIRNDMALVGPRPESLRFADCFAGQFVDLLQFKPGIFGPAQVRFRNESDYYQVGEDPERIYRQVLFPTKGTIDLQYYSSRTLLQDIAWAGRGAMAVTRISGGKHSWQRVRAREDQPLLQNPVL
jgi:lipopolysaccharide/colanic/teichoic acid biosynthesis glycosyltransferase